MVIDYLKILLVFKGRRWHGIGKKAKMCCSGDSFSYSACNIQSPKFAVSDSEGLCATSKLFWPHCAAACMLDGETTLLNTELGQPLPLHSEI